MCGLTGVISKNTNLWKTHTEMFHELLFVDVFRGRDSTGAFMIDKDGDLEMLKEASPSPDFQRTKEYHEFMGAAYSRGRALIGHNRAATKGVVTDENAHPFIVDDRIILVHNGTLYGDYKKLAGEGNDVEVDSHAIAHLIHQHGDNVEAAMQELNGAFALIWFDMEKQSLNFLRNSQRPLYWLETNDCYVWASERNFLDWMVSRHNLTNAQIHPLKEGVLTSLLFEKNSIKVENKPISFIKPLAAGRTTTVQPLPWERDACGSRMGHLTNGYLSEDEMWDHAYGQCGPVSQRPDEEITRLSKALQKQEEKRLREKHNLTAFEEASTKIVEESRGFTERVQETLAQRLEEAQMAAERGGQITVVKWAALNTDFKDNNRYRITCFDYEYVNKRDGTKGYWLYGILANSAQFLCRCFVPSDTPELMLVDLTSNHKDASVEVNGRCWRSFENQKFATAAGDGYGLMFAKHAKKIAFEAPKGSTTVNVEPQEIKNA